MKKLKHLYVSLVLLSATGLVQAQNTLSEAFSIGGVGTEYEGICAPSSNGYIALCGSSNSPTFDADPGAGTTLINNQGSEDAFLSLYDILGNHQWTVQIGAAGTQRIMDVVCGPNEIYVCGYYQNTVDFDPTSGVSNLTGSPSQFSGFIARYNPVGTLDWVAGLSPLAIPRGLAVSSTGTVGVAGGFTGTCDFDPGSGIVNLSANGVYDGFYVELNANNGQHIRSITVGGAGYDLINSVVFTGTDIVMGGAYSDTVDFDPSTGVYALPAAGTQTGFVLSLDANLDFNWAYSNNSASDAFDFVERGSTANEVYAASDFKLYRFSSSGAVMLMHDFNAQISALRLKPNGEIAVAGTAGPSVDLDPGPTSVFTSAPCTFLAEFTGNTMSFVKFVEGFAPIYGLSYLSGYGAFVSGIFQGTVDFNPASPADTLTSFGTTATDLYMCFYNSCSVEYVNYAANLCPGDTVAVGALHFTSAEWIQGSPQLICVEFNSAYNQTETLMWNKNGEIGCDTIFTVTLTAMPILNFNQTITVCQGNSVTVGNNIYNVSGTYQDVFTAISGCDSTVNTTVVITPVDTNLTQTATSLISINANATYQWIDCSTGQLIPGATQNFYTPTANGEYACIFVENGCTDTSGCYQFTEVGINEFNADIVITLSPNPASDHLNITCSAEIERIEVRDITGRLVITENTNGSLIIIDTSLLSNGFYTVTALGKYGSTNSKFQKQ